MTMEWNGQPLVTVGDVAEAVVGIIRTGTREDAQRFMATYHQVCTEPAASIGYLAGYYDTATAQRIWDWFECAHPIFGTRIPTAEEAFEAGRRWGREAAEHPGS